MEVSYLTYCIKQIHAVRKVNLLQVELSALQPAQGVRAYEARRVATALLKFSRSGRGNRGTAGSFQTVCGAFLFGCLADDNVRRMFVQQLRNVCQTPDLILRQR